MTDLGQDVRLILERISKGHDASLNSAGAAYLLSALAEPRLPKELSDDVKAAMRQAFDVSYCHTDFIAAMHRALYAHLTKPKTKVVWEIHCVGAPAATLFERWPDATCELSRLVELGKRVTIKRHEVPA